MLTLGIETSCDETAVAVLNGPNKVLSNVISSSLLRHQPFGGVVPEIASRHVLEQIDFVFREAMRKARVRVSNLDLVAVTKGPGLIGSLFVGVCFGKSLSYRLGIPLIGVNHLEAHLVANFIGKKEPARYVGLLVSGGHTSLSYHERGKVTLLGSTVDDAVGEAYDKVARILGLGYPGGPIIERLAKRGNPGAFRFTKPKQKNRFDFSLSGIKTAVLYEVEKQRYGVRPVPLPGKGNVVKSSRHGRRGKKLPHSFVCDMARCFQDAVVGWLVDKSMDAVQHKKVKHVVAGGGVCANRFLRQRLSESGAQHGIKVWFPEHAFTLDNAAMVARRGLELYRKGRRSPLTLTGVPNLKIA